MAKKQIILDSKYMSKISRQGWDKMTPDQRSARIENMNKARIKKMKANKRLLASIAK